MNLQDAGCAQGLGAFIEGRPGGEDIINEEHATSFDLAGNRHLEGILDILQALFPVQTRLRFRPALSDEDLELDRKAKLTAKSFREQPSLVEASLSQTFHMEGDR